MAHDLSFINNIAEFAYLTGTPVWHGFGQAIPEDQAHNIDAWLYSSNMGNWTIKTAPVLAYDADDDELITFDNRKLLYRSDTKQPLADVGANYNVVQPSEVVRFFEKLIDTMGFKMVTCGVLFGGRKFWAQADIGQSTNILGTDRINGQLLLATSCDGSMATTAQYTTTRVVCNNTLRMAMGNGASSIRMLHSSAFDAKVAYDLLQIDPDAMKAWGEMAERMAQIKLTETQVLDYLGAVLAPVNKNAISTGSELLDTIAEETMGKDNHDIALASILDAAIAETEGTGKPLLDSIIEEYSPTVLKVHELFNGAGIGSDIAGQTLWGAVNAVTEYMDHHRKTKTMDARIDRAWFGDSANYKDKAWELAAQMVA